MRKTGVAMDHSTDAVAGGDRPGERVSAASSFLVGSQSRAATASWTGRSSSRSDELVSAPTIGIVVTPGSGEGRARGVARRLERLLRRRGHASATRTFKDLPSLI